MCELNDRTVLKVIDNSGARKAQCKSITKNTKYRARLGIN